MCLITLWKHRCNNLMKFSNKSVQAKTKKEHKYKYTFASYGAFNDY